MELPEIISALDAKKSELDLLRPLSEEQQNKLEQKLRLDWNYHSNSIEGNTLTAHETKAFILHGITAKGKPFRDYIEMRGHNETLKKLTGLVDKDVMISEKLIMDLHQMILVEPFTDDKTEIAPGKYKTKPNYLYTITGERIDFLPPEEVVKELNTLINWLNNQIEKPKRKKRKYNLHPILISAAFQVRFIQIHPFGDGNGRLSRILGNLILMQCGYTPAIIRLEERDTYYSMLNLSSLENPLPLAELIATESLKTTELAIAAAQGKSIDEPDDLEKELALLEQKINGSNKEVPRRSNNHINQVLIAVFLPVLFEYDRQWAKLRDKFIINKAEIMTKNGKAQKFEWLPDQREEYWGSYDLATIDYLQFRIFLQEFKPLLPKQESLSLGFTLYFHDYKFEIEHHYPDHLKSEHLYNEKIDLEVLTSSVKQSVRQLVQKLNALVENKNETGI